MRLLLLGLAHLWPIQALAGHDAIPDPPPASSDAELPRDLSLDPASVTVSGLSSGGFFAHQFHVAHSERIAGAGIIAGGPYGCVETITNPFWPFATLDRLSAALVACTHYWGDRYWGLRPSPPEASDSLALIEEAFEAGEIDDPGFLAGDRVWLFRGEADEVVPEGVGDALEGVYRQYIDEQELVVYRHPAAHGLPVSRFPDDSRFSPPACQEHKEPFLVTCGFDAAELLFRHLYPDSVSPEPADAHEAGTLAPFDQTPFAGSGESFHPAGYVYVPDACESQSCRLHVAFHGCRQGIEAVHDDFVRDARYNAWAAAGRIVVLYPQVAPSSANPNGCWDFWGYSGDDYRSKDGPQMQAVKAMIDRLLGANE